ncbi:MAG: nuclear transport factor 2 family protein [Desulfobulbaceae bacterium]|nr:nuclear transport factor 2 family protein [Desulfobulbaceae bacterium]
MKTFFISVSSAILLSILCGCASIHHGEEATTRSVAERWFKAIEDGDVDTALNMLDDKIVWQNIPKAKGLSDIIPWLGTYRGREEVIKSFRIWGENSDVNSFKVEKILVQGNEVIGLCHEIATIKETGIRAEIFFIQYFTVENEKLVQWRSFWDPCPYISAFRGQEVEYLEPR